jgi:hypothetical protein
MHAKLCVCVQSSELSTCVQNSEALPRNTCGREHAGASGATSKPRTSEDLSVLDRQRMTGLTPPTLDGPTLATTRSSTNSSRTPSASDVDDHVDGAEGGGRGGKGGEGRSRPLSWNMPASRAQGTSATSSYARARPVPGGREGDERKGIEGAAEALSQSLAQTWAAKGLST